MIHCFIGCGYTISIGCGYTISILNRILKGQTKPNQTKTNWHYWAVTARAVTGGECPCSGSTASFQCIVPAADHFATEHSVDFGGDKTQSLLETQNPS